MIEKEKIVEVLEESKDRIMSRGYHGLCFAISETLVDKGLVTEKCAILTDVRRYKNLFQNLPHHFLV